MMLHTLLLSLGLASQAAWAQAPAGVHVSELSYNGPGCPRGTVASNVSPDSQALSLDLTLTRHPCVGERASH